MSFAAPIWLLALVPWAGVVLYLLWGRRRRVDVPFLELWPAHGDGIRVRRRAAPPPIALALAILATLLALLAAARPAVKLPGRGEPIVVVIDRGWTMALPASISQQMYKESVPYVSSRRLHVWTVPPPPGASEPIEMNGSDLSLGP